MQCLMNGLSDTENSTYIMKSILIWEAEMAQCLEQS